MKLVYTPLSKRSFYCRDAVSEFVLKAGQVPLNPFRVFGYFLGDRVERDAVRRANFAIVERCDEVWVFGTELADGVLAEIAWAHEQGKPVRTFTIATRAQEVREVGVEELTFEAELLEGELTEEELREVAQGLRPFRRADVFAPALGARR